MPYRVLWITTIILTGCHRSPSISHQLLDAPQTQLSSSVMVDPEISQTTPVLPESPQPHKITSGMPLTIGPGYSCVILAHAQLEFLHATPIKNARLTCVNSAYEIAHSTNTGVARFFLAIDNPTVFIRGTSTHITINTLDAVVESVPHECQIVVDVLPNAAPTEVIRGRRLSLLLSNYVIPDTDHSLCDQATRITSYLIPYVLG